MVTFVALLGVAAALGGWDRYTRHHPAWEASTYARFCISSGYPMMAIAAYFLAGFAGDHDWAWLFGLTWALAAITVFVAGHSALNAVLKRHRATSLAIETINNAPEFQAPTG